MSSDIAATPPPPSVPPSWGPNTGRNVLGRTYYLDANTFIDLENDPSTDTPMGFIYRAFVEGWLGIGLTDTTAVERHGKFGLDLGLRDPALWAFESPGPLVLGHSRLDSSVTSSEADAARLDAIHRILKPGKQPDQLNHHDFRDGLQINTTLRYGGRHFITRDNKILKRSQVFYDTFELVVITPADARTAVMSAIESARAREAARGNTMWLPDWPQ